MDTDDLAAGAFAESVVFLRFFDDLPDPRQHGKVKYPLAEILLLYLLAVLAGADCIADIARFGEKKRDLLRRFRPFADGTPSHHHLGDILASLDATRSSSVSWPGRRRPGRDRHRRQDLAPILPDEGRRRSDPLVSAFAARQRLVLGPVKVADKSNEIIAIPKLLAMMAIKGAIVTIDAIGCQREIARAIVDRKADYILALKGNQGTLRKDVDLFLAEQKAHGFKDTIVSRDTTIDGDHGRIATRTTTVTHRVDWLDDHRWPGLKSIVVVDARREIDGKIQTETRLYITSLVLLAHVIGPLVRSHWTIENGLHWVMDMVFPDDDCRVRTDHAPANFTTIKHMALNLTRRVPGKDSIRMKRKVAAWDDDYLASLIAP